MRCTLLGAQGLPVAIIAPRYQELNGLDAAGQTLGSYPSRVRGSRLPPPSNYAIEEVNRREEVNAAVDELLFSFSAIGCSGRGARTKESLVGSLASR